MTLADKPKPPARHKPTVWHRLQKAFQQIPWFHYALAVFFVLAGVWVLYQQDVDKTLACTQQTGSSIQCRLTIASVFGTRSQPLTISGPSQAVVDRRVNTGRGFSGKSYHVKLVSSHGKKQTLFIYPQSQRQQAYAQALMLNKFIQADENQTLQLQQHRKQWTNGLVLTAIGFSYLLGLVLLCFYIQKKK